MKKKKILLLTDDIRAHSGVAQIGRELVINTSHILDWVQIAGSVNHPEEGKRLDLSEDTNLKANIDNSSVIIYPTSQGYGNPTLLRNLMEIEKPDAIMMITDPRYFEWLFKMESEIRQNIPIIYLNIWDNLPAPHFNREYYESCDLLLSISKQTKLINKLVLEGGRIPYYDLDLKMSNDLGINKNRVQPIILKYLPHGLDENVFKPIKKYDPLLTKVKEKLDNGKSYDFTLFFNSRNIRRKSIPDLIIAWKLFLESLDKSKSSKCRLLLHTTPVDPNGTDLYELIDNFFPSQEGNITLSTSKITGEELNILYNIADGVILPSSNEGWGLSLTEALLSGTPIIANVTGGMQDQMRFEVNGEWYNPTPKIPSNHRGTIKECGEWALPIFPSNISLVGSPATPYIFDDKCSPKDISLKIKELYEMGNSERERIGNKGREWALSDEAGFTSKIMSERFIDSFDYLMKKWKPRERFELYSDKDYNPRKLNHNLEY